MSSVTIELEGLPGALKRYLRELRVESPEGLLSAKFHPKTGQPTSSPVYPGEGPTVTIQWRGKDYVEIPRLVFVAFVEAFVASRYGDLRGP